MSYETNPILNRIKLSKGWKTSTFPTNSLNYSRDTMLWFKVYLFLKVYLLLHGFRLLTSEMRLSDDYAKILYLSVTKQSFPLAKSKSKRKTKSFLQNLRSPLTKIHNKKARFLLYLDLQKLKKISILHFNNTRKKIFSQTWIAKPRRDSWINTTHLIYNWRKNIKYKQQYHWKRKNIFRLKKINFITCPGEKNVISFEKNISHIAKKELFWKKKQRNVSSLLTKMQKNIFFLERGPTFHDFSVQTQKNDSRRHSLAKFLTYQSRRKKLFLKQIQILYAVIKKKKALLQQKYLNPKVMLNKRHFFVKKKLCLAQENFFWLHFIQQFRFSQWKPFFAFSFLKRIVLSNQKHFWKKENHIPHSSAKVLFQRRITSVKKNFFLRKTVLLSHLITKKKSYNSTALSFLSKTRFFQKFRPITLARLFLWKRIAQQKKILAKKKKLVKKKKPESFYRCSYRLNYRKLLHFSTGVKLTYLIEDLIKKYFTLPVKVKVCWPLSQFKNLKFYRLVFPKYKQRRQGKKTFLLKIQKNNRFGRKKYFFIGYNTHRLTFGPNNFLSTTKENKGCLSSFKNSKSLLNLTKNQPYKGTLLNFWQKEKKKKKNKYLMLKTKNIRLKSEKRLSWSAKEFFTSGLITTLTLFVKYLDPQPVVDHLAKIIGGTKKHVATLKLIETILRTFHLKRGLGYRIALIGRINGANKSRTIYLRKLNRNRSRQSFSKNVNFALAHARASIGTFAIKLWVYS